MTSGLDRFVRQLEDAADGIGDMPRHELQILLRRAVLQLRNVGCLALKPETATTFIDVAQLTDADCNELASLIIHDWLVANGYLAYHDLDEDTEPDGAA